MERVEAPLHGLGTDGLDAFEPVFTTVQEVGLEPLERLDARRDSEEIVRALCELSASSTPPEPNESGG